MSLPGGWWVLSSRMAVRRFDALDAGCTKDLSARDLKPDKLLARRMLREQALQATATEGGEREVMWTTDSPSRFLPSML